MDKKLVGIVVLATTLAGTLLLRLVTWNNPEPNKIGMFSGPDIPNARGIGIIEYFQLYFASLTPVQWLSFVIGALVAIFLIIGIPQLLDRYGGDNWK